MIYAVLARDRNNLIGNGGSLPWKDDEETKWDLANFKSLTSGNIVFMGYRTFLGFEKPLPNRINVVETRENFTIKDYRVKPDNDKNGFIMSSSLDDFLSSKSSEFESTWKSKKLFIIGGSKTFQKYKEKIDFLYLTTFYGEYKGDVFLPEDFLDGFKLKSQIESHGNGKIELFERNYNKIL